MANRLQDKVAIVTGGGRGIGEAIVRAFHAEGARVVISDVTGDQAALAAELGDGATAVTADMRDDEAVRQMVASTLEAYGRLDILCNNAGLDGDVAPTADCTPANFDHVMSVNLRGVFLGTHHALPALIASGGGSIINVSSAAGLVGIPGLSAYCASKAGVIGLTRAVALEYAEAGVRVNAICPGGVVTPLFLELQEHAPEQAAAMTAALEQATAMRRMAQPVEIGPVAVFLASGESSFMTGAVLPIDGGYTAA